MYTHLIVSFLIMVEILFNKRYFENELSFSVCVLSVSVKKQMNLADNAFLE